MTAPSPESAAPPPSPGPPPAGGPGTRSSRRLLLVVVIAIAISALALALLGIGTAAVLFLRGGEPEPAPTTAAPTYEAPTPMTQVETDWYTFAYPQHWQDTGEDVDPVNWHYGLSTLDVMENTKMIVMDYPLRDETWEEACAGLATVSAKYSPQPDVVVDGRETLHYQRMDEVPETGEARVQDMWCMPREGNIVVVLGRTAGPEAVAAGISEVQKVLDTWTWKDA